MNDRLKTGQTIQLCINAIEAAETNNDILANLICFRKDYSPKAGDLMGKIITASLNASSMHEGAIRDARSWCEMVIPLLEAYIELNHAESREAIINVLETNEKEYAEKVINKLEECQIYLNTIQGYLVSLKAQLDIDFNEKSAYYQALLQKIKICVYGMTFVAAGVAAWVIKESLVNNDAQPTIPTATSGLDLNVMSTVATKGMTSAMDSASETLFGPDGIEFFKGAVSIAGKIVINAVEPQLNQCLEEIKQKFDDATKFIQNASVSVKEATKILKQDLNSTTNIQSQTNSTRAIISASPNGATNSAKELIQLCQEFVHRHPSNSTPLLNLNPFEEPREIKSSQPNSH